MPHSDLGAKDRILAAAAGIFGEKGFKEGSIREICKTAGVNLASVNYHFGNKRHLYETVLDKLMAARYGTYPPDMGVAPDSSAEDRLFAFLRAFLLRMLGEEDDPNRLALVKMMSREIVDPTPALDVLALKYVLPQRIALGAILLDLLGAQATPERMERCGLSIMGQCFYQVFAGSLIARIGLSRVSDDEVIERLARHITLFSLGGIERIRAEGSTDT
jgi:AcrR family transcriptional regulator